MTNSLGRSSYRGADAWRAQALFQTTTSSKATTSSPRMKTTIRTSAIRSPIASFNFYDLGLDYGPSDRDIRHKFNFFTYAELPGEFMANVRMQARTAQPITTSPRVLNGVDRGRNWDRKDNAYFSLDWRLQRAFKLGDCQLIPSLEMFNTFNNANNVNPLTTPALFNFDGFLRQGVGDPRQMQLAGEVHLLARRRARGALERRDHPAIPSSEGQLDRRSFASSGMSACSCDQLSAAGTWTAHPPVSIHRHDVRLERIADHQEAIGVDAVSREDRRVHVPRSCG